jgi:biopolymer transport protein ExbB/TolQ
MVRRSDSSLVSIRSIPEVSSMNSAKPTAARRRVALRSSTLAAFLLGIPMAIVVLALVYLGPLGGTEAHRYLSHPVEVVELVLFCCALGCLGSKLYFNRAERAACRRELLAPWDGQAVPAAEAPQLRAAVHTQAGGLQHTLFARRVDAVLGFVGQRRSAEGLDDQLRALADADALILDNSYALVRFITWAIPILGFLGTVLGITKAIAGVTPEILEKSLSSVTEGLSLAFDTTAVGLALTMLTMFLSFISERIEQAILDYVDHYADVQLAHRFERSAAEGGDYVAALGQSTQMLLRTTEQLVVRQAQVWADALEAAEKRWTEAGQRQQAHVAAALEKALDKTLLTHQARLAELEKLIDRQAAAQHSAGSAHQQALARVTDAVAAQTAALAQLQGDGQQLVRLQDALHRNLAALQGTGSFEQAVQALTAAIHLLTAKATPGVVAPPLNRLGTRPGAAA